MNVTSNAFRILSALHGSEPMTPVDLIEPTGIQRNNLNRYLGELVEGKFVERMEKQPHERGYRYKATELGAKTVEAAGPVTPQREWKASAPTKKKSRKNRVKTPVKTPAKAPAAKANGETQAFRVGLFNDGSLAILARRGAIELDEDETLELATYLRAQFSEAEA